MTKIIRDCITSFFWQFHLLQRSILRSGVTNDWANISPTETPMKEINLALETFAIRILNLLLFEQPTSFTSKIVKYIAKD